MTRKACIVGGATMPFDHGPTCFENIEQDAADCNKETKQDVPEEDVASIGAKNRNNPMYNPKK
jgi:hypothetical protein